MEQQFGRLVRDRYEYLKREEGQNLFYRLDQFSLTSREFSVKKLDSRKHRILWSYRVCAALEIDAEAGFKAILQDQGYNPEISLSELYVLSPALFLYKHAFNALRLEQICEKATAGQPVCSDVIRLQKENKSIEQVLINANFGTNYRFDALLSRYFQMKTVKEIADSTYTVKRSINRSIKSGLEHLSKQKNLAQILESYD